MIFKSNDFKLPSFCITFFCYFYKALHRFFILFEFICMLYHRLMIALYICSSLLFFASAMTIRFLCVLS